MTTTAIPVTDALGDMQPGAYVITAKVDRRQAGLLGRDGHAVVHRHRPRPDHGLRATTASTPSCARSTSAQPVAGAKVRLVAVNNEILGEATTDADGRADFAPGLARGEGGRAPQLLVAETDGGDYAFLDLTKPAFDLTDRGVEGRPSPGPLDLFATTERGVYRPGETVYPDRAAARRARRGRHRPAADPGGRAAGRRRGRARGARRRRRRRLFRRHPAGRRRHARLVAHPALCRSQGRRARRAPPSWSRISSPSGWPSRSAPPTGRSPTGEVTPIDRRRQVSLWRHRARTSPSRPTRSCAR